MGIMIDTNVLISAALFSNSKLVKAVIEISDKHTVLQLRDSKYTPILVSAIYENVDVLIIGDNDFQIWMLTVLNY